MGSIFLTCPECQRKIRQFTKDLDRVEVRVCPDCGTSVRIKEIQNDLCANS